ncbi:uncharacterized protein Z520_02873 [Fonsecaea multimorphosa CBS 102226]|uniref:Myb-like DNA-binding domain-containing protein n=1 Tax=Fonsecaea multimorphosa CBS 102226 TaxID=1442371 RepID=A0A0D2HHD6_9EURO|nr:uncharacterized protein Z520_02873 [Fonsecaea multimorphosa CBS 102226]KIY01321.1 hypothetical protein Z520_02873 [Fonsecaea multimorphosa CBS 102226]OAL28598.1 hypothetical protein AYO22_02792 [Fonsecaea multimorphosa]
MAPFQADDNVVFLYHCLVNASGKVDWNAVAIATGSTRGAVEIRWRRLKKKIEDNTNTGQPATPTPAQPPQGRKASQGKKQNTGTRKRKMEDAEDDEDEADVAGPPQVDGQVDVKPSSRRQTRGKRLKYDIKACLANDEDSSAITSSDSDEDYVVDAEAIKSEDDELFMFDMFDCSGDLKPKPKRDNKSQPTPPKVHRQTATKKAVPPINVNDVQQKTVAVPKAKVRSSMHPSDQPLPSIEHSPPNTPLSSVFTSEKQGVVDTHSEITLENLKPGMVLQLPPKSRPQILEGIADCTVPKPDLASSVISMTSSISATSSFTTTDSIGKMIQQDLANHVEIRPEDSVSYVAVDAEQDSMPTAPTPTGIMANTLRFFKVLLTPQT